MNIFIVVAVILIMIWGIILFFKSHRKYKAGLKEYNFEVKSFHLPNDGVIEYAQWLHPKEKPKEITQISVDSVRKFVNKGDTVIDIGAHTGDTTVPMAVAAGVSGCTLALEPNPYVYKILEQNAKLNIHKTNILPLNFAATQTDGIFNFHYSDSAYCNGGFLSQIKNQKHRHKYSLQVQGRNLEKFLRSNYSDRLHRLSFIKIDTEGYDKNVIVNILNILQEYQPVLLTEVYKMLVKDERQALFDVLEKAGYECFKYVSGYNPRGEQVYRQDLMKWRHFDILAIPKKRA